MPDANGKIRGITVPRLWPGHRDWEDNVSVVLLQADDWQGLYVDGKLVLEEHRIAPRDIAQHTPGFEAHFVSEEQDRLMSEKGIGFPESLAEAVYE